MPPLRSNFSEQYAQDNTRNEQQMTKRNARAQSHRIHPLILSLFSSVVLFLQKDLRTEANLTAFIFPLLSALSLLAFVSSCFFLWRKECITLDERSVWTGTEREASTCLLHK